ncbi:hypothetical protein BD626DRAFT_399297 [Schizophyllum amplum]|uniref:Uncharacterized protein n=1 Tax=Schizophyllum amplum TaxID=97359 RepID=A0A550CL06_9AGAR|nr:hypothetical protein BD626DRAFT_399297 [Auriculariopsis ampla]
MQVLEGELRCRGIAFDFEGNRVCCFPHVVNIATQTGLEVVKTPRICYDFDVALPPELIDDPQYRCALEGDIVGSARRIVTAVRVSGQRREHLQDIIKDGNAKGRWLDAKNNPEIMHILCLLRDVDTRWSSTFLMIDRLLLLYRAVDEFLRSEKYSGTDIAALALSTVQLDVLRDVRLYLSVLHMVQEMVSGQKTPTLAYVLPAYAMLLDALRALKNKLPKLSHVIDVTIMKLEVYMNKALHTDAYAISMSESLLCEQRRLTDDAAVQ